MIKAKAPIFFFGLFIVIASLFILYITIVELRENTTYPIKSSPGEINVSDISFNDSKLIGLVGDYEFYWNQLLTPNDFKDSTKKNLSGYIHVPGLWNGYKVDGEKLSGDGYATFRILIRVPDEDLYSVKIKEFDCAYRIWINGHYTECGTVGINKYQEKPSWKRNQVIAYTRDKQIELIIQVSNFNHRKGGLEDLMLLGKCDSVLNYKNNQLAVTYFLIGLFFIMFVYNYGLFIYRQKEKSYLYFSIICLLILLREATTGEKVIYDIIPNINWWIMIRVEYLSYTMVIPLFYMFVRALSPESLSKSYEKVINIISAIVVMIILFTPVKVFSYTPIFYQVVVALTAVLILLGLIKAAINKKDDSLFMLFGYSMLFAISINDILYYNKILNTAFLMPFGLFVIVFVNAFTLSKRFSNSFATIEALTRDLSESNLELEKKVTERTREVMHQKQEIENQAIALQETNKKILDLSKFKDSMTHMIVHDLKNPLHTIMNISTMEDIPQKNYLIHEAGREMNNLVLNILDVYKYENTSMVLNRELVNIKELVDGAINDVSFLGRLRNVVFEFDIIDNISLNIDKSIMHRVLVNLLTNAIKFSPLSGKVEIGTQIDNNEYLKISVKDNGPGIRPERQKTIFDRYQAEAQVDSLILSTGLGLNFCKLAIESHGGTISLESIEKQGAKFSIVLALS
jgi:signal transduction histidine kinase